MHGSFKLVVSALPLFGDQQTTLAECAAVFKHCLRIVDANEDDSGGSGGVNNILLVNDGIITAEDGLRTGFLLITIKAFPTPLVDNKIKPMRVVVFIIVVTANSCLRPKNSRPMGEESVFLVLMDPSKLFRDH